MSKQTRVAWTRFFRRWRPAAVISEGWFCESMPANRPLDLHAAGGDDRATLRPRTYPWANSAGATIHKPAVAVSRLWRPIQRVVSPVTVAGRAIRPPGGPRIADSRSTHVKALRKVA